MSPTEPATMAGLGLSISSQLVALMGGTIWVESQPGRGSTFHFKVRLGAKAGGARQDDRQSSGRAHLPGEGQRRFKILLAEDNLVNQKVAVRLLEKKGHTVVVAESGKKALDAWRKQPFDLTSLSSR